jgi:transposase
MLDQDMRTTILLLGAQKMSIRAIARTCKVARNSVQTVLRSGSKVVPVPARLEKAQAWEESIRELHQIYKGNLRLVYEELETLGAEFSYAALTGFCRRHEIGFKPKAPSGRYHFDAGEEMQHDTSPHKVMIGGKLRLVQSASLVLCFSRMVFMRYYPTFDRFWAKVFLTEAFTFFGGACKRCEIDNTHVVVAHGTGATMIPAPEMAAFAGRFGFEFQAHEVGDANRSARVERMFHFIEHNFLPGKDFKDWDDLNQQARAWCEKVNAMTKRAIHARPIDLFGQERNALKPLPGYVPEVYRLHHRIVDNEGYVTLRLTRYSVPYKLMGRQLELRENQHRIEIYQGPRVVASHANTWDSNDTRVTLREHRPPRGEGRGMVKSAPGEVELLQLEPGLAAYVLALKARSSGRAALVLKRLLGMVRDYPREALLKAVDEALAYGMFDLTRLDAMVLRNVRQDYFVMADENPALEEETHEG